MNILNRYKIIVVLLIFNCESKINTNKINYLTDDYSKLWVLKHKENTIENEWYTFWYFTKQEDFYMYYYNNSSGKLEFYDGGDNIFENKYKYVKKDTIEIEGSIYPIIKISDKELILRDVYNSYFFNDGNIHLKSCLDECNIFNESCDKILEKIKSLNEKKMLP